METTKHDNWVTTFKKFRLLVELTVETEGYIGPLILSGCFVYVSFIVVFVFGWIAPDIPISFATALPAYVYYCSIYFMIRTAAVIYFVSEVHQSSILILKSIEGCGCKHYSLQV